MKIVLASQSLIRKRALDLLGLTYETIPSNINEKAIRDPDPLKMAQRILKSQIACLNPTTIGLGPFHLKAISMRLPFVFLARVVDR
jgi:hypothetical protein